MAKFFVKRLYKYPNVATIVWYHQKHTYEDGSPTHGTFDFKSPHANCILIELKAWIQE
jgi:hypothetical protein